MGDDAAAEEAAEMLIEDDSDEEVDEDTDSDDTEDIDSDDTEDTDSDDTDDDEDELSELGIEVADLDNMQVDEYAEYVSLETIFSALDITDPNLTSEEEYEMFVEPIYVTTKAMETVVLNMSISIDTAEATVYNAAVSLYDNILILEGYLELQTMNYEMSQSDFANGIKKYEMGEISRADYNILENKEKIAKLNMESMARKVDNLKMNLNTLIGIDVETEVTFTSELGDTITLESIDYYTEKALKERNEILSLSNNYTAKLKEYKHIDDFFSSSSESYKIVDGELTDLELQEEQLQQQIKQEIRQAYMNVSEKEENFKIAKLKIEDAKRQYDNLKSNVKVGFVTQSKLLGLDLMVEQATEDYYAAYSDYLEAVTSLESASSIGPGFSS
jgi:outer membrane protein TolC